MLTRVAFISHRCLLDYEVNSDFEFELIKDLLYPGMRKLFQYPQQPVYYWTEHRGDLIDILIYLEDSEGVGYQVWLMSIITCSGKGFTFKESKNCPFPSIPFIWKDTCETFLNAWASFYFCDWNPLWVEKDLRSMSNWVLT